MHDLETIKKMNAEDVVQDLENLHSQVQALDEELCMREDKIVDLEADLEDAQQDARNWENKYADLCEAVRRAQFELEHVG